MVVLFFYYSGSVGVGGYLNIILGVWVLADIWGASVCWSTFQCFANVQATQLN